MSLTAVQVDPYLKELGRLQREALYSAQTYYEASKRLDALARRLVFLPSCASAVAAFAVAVGAWRWVGGVSALASVMVATATYVGVDRKGASYKRTANQMTALRHKVALAVNLARSEPSVDALAERTRVLATPMRRW